MYSNGLFLFVHIIGLVGCLKNNDGDAYGSLDTTRAWDAATSGWAGAAILHGHQRIVVGPVWIYAAESNPGRSFYAGCLCKDSHIHGPALSVRKDSQFAR
jgi:hypothetical protein